MIRTSEAINEISEALARAQGKFGAAIKSSQNPAFRSKYADLSSVIDATLEHLNAEGITCMQHPMLEFKGEAESREAFVTVTTRLLHKSGQWLESDLSIPAVQRDRFDAQSCGSALTYACRYALQSICCVPREDDDGNLAAGRGSTEAAQAVAKQKIAQHAKDKANGSPAAQECVKELIYSYPSSFNGHKAEFFNVRRFLADNPEHEEAVRMVFTKHKAKKTADETALVPQESMQALLEELSGSLGITVHELAGR